MIVRPATCEVELADGIARLEPRVMQVLVALIDAKDRVVGRDALVEQCWDGLSVGDDAINRVTARVRRLGQESGAFALETVRKVGYRLAVAGEAGPLTPTQRIARQQLISPRRRAARASALVSTVLLGVIAVVMYQLGQRPVAAVATASTSTQALSAPVLARLPGRWGPAGCATSYDLVVRGGRIVMTAPEYRSERRIVAASTDAIMTEGQLPADERGRLIDFRPDGDRLQILNRSTDAGLSLVICPLAKR